MSQKHNQRTRAQILARRAAPTPTKRRPFATLALGAWFIDSLRYTAATRRAMRSKYMPHEGAQQR